MFRIMTMTMIGLALTFVTPATAAELGTPDEAKALAERAAVAYGQMGRESAFNAYNDKSGTFIVEFGDTAETSPPNLRQCLTQKSLFSNSGFKGGERCLKTSQSQSNPFWHHRSWQVFWS